MSEAVIRRVEAHPVRRAGLVGALLALSVSAAAAQGYEGTEEERVACTPDAMSLCNAYIPDAGRVKECLIQHVSDLSPACRDVFEAKRRTEPEKSK